MIGEGLMLALLPILVRCWCPAVEDASGAGDELTGDNVVVSTAPVAFDAVLDLLLLLPLVRRC